MIEPSSLILSAICVPILFGGVAAVAGDKIGRRVTTATFWGISVLLIFIAWLQVLNFNGMNNVVNPYDSNGMLTNRTSQLSTKTIPDSDAMTQLFDPDRVKADGIKLYRSRQKDN